MHFTVRRGYKLDAISKQEKDCTDEKEVVKLKRLTRTDVNRVLKKSDM